MNSALIAKRPEQLTTTWAQQIVNLHQSDLTVTATEILAIDTGTTTRVRLAVSYQQPTLLPQRWFIKMPSLAWRARFITGLPQLLTIETRFYQELAAELPIALPVCLAAARQFGQGTTLVLADVAEHNAQAGITGESVDLAQAQAVVRELARFHAQFWQPQRPAHPAWLADPIRQIEDHLGTVLAVPLMRLGLHRAKTLLPDLLQRQALHYARNRRSAMRFLSNPQTLVHHDCHAGNLYWKNGQPGFLDWQMVRIGEAVSDVAYFFATALTTPLRRDCERYLLGYYAECLREQGIMSDPHSLWTRYCAHLTYAFEAMMVTLAIGGLMPAEANRELIRRTASAVQDHDAFSMLAL